MKHLGRHPKSFPKSDMPSLYHALRSLREQAKTIPACTPLRYVPTPEDAKHSPKAPLQGTLCYHDNQCVVVTDPFRKSQVHCIVMPWDTSLKSLNDVDGSKHLGLLEHMNNVGKQYAEFIRGGNGSDGSSASSSSSTTNPYSNLRMLCGYHSIPSLPMLHMHLISLDLESARLKSKTHYNTFATYYFLPADMVVEDVKKHGVVTLNQDVDRLEKLAAQPMVCLWCGIDLKNMPHLKEHIPSCPKNMSRGV